MRSYAIACIVTLVLFSENDGRLHRRSHLLRRQNGQMFQNPNRMVQGFFPMQPPASQFPPAYQPPLAPNSVLLPFPYAMMPPTFMYTPGSVAFSGGNPNPVVYEPQVVNSTTVPSLPQPQYQNSNFQNATQYQNQPAISVKRRRKNVSDNKNTVKELLEKGKKILQMPTVDKTLGNKNFLFSPNDSFGDDYETDSNATIIPIPKGVQLKYMTEHDKNNVQKVVNISSTQRTLSVDNNTQIENVVEMQMEKKVEDEKGDNKGSEQVRIVETELVKPLIKKKWDNLTHGKRDRRFRHSKFATHRRSKRSETDSEVLRSASLYNKMARKYLSDLKRKERMVERNDFLNRQEASNSRESEFGGIVSKAKELTGKLTKDDSVYDTDEMGDFLKHFLDRLKRFRKIRENIGDKAKSRKFSNDSDNGYGLKQQVKHIKKNKHHEYPEHMKMIMNLNITWDAKRKDRLERSPNEQEKTTNSVASLGTTDNPVEPTTHQMALNILFINDGKGTDARFLTVMLLLSVVIFLLPVLAWTLPKVYWTARLAPRSSGIRTYRFYPESENEKAKGIGNFRGQCGCTENHPQLEWQSENGDWLSEKEMDFK